MEVPVGTSQGASTGLKQSQELPNSALTKTYSFPPSGEAKDYSGKQMQQSIRLGDPMGTGMPPIPAGLGSHPSLSHQIPLVNLAATPAQQLCKVQQELVKATCPEHPGLCSSLQKPFLGSVGSSSRSSGEGNLPIQLTALTLLLLIPAASRWCWGLCE